MGGEAIPERQEGGTVPSERPAVFIEPDYAYLEPRTELGLPPDRANGRMFRTQQWKYVEFQGLPPQLFNLAEDPDRFQDLGTDAQFAWRRVALAGLLHDRSMSRKNRVTDKQEGIENWLSETLGSEGKSDW